MLEEDAMEELQLVVDTAKWRLWGEEGTKGGGEG
jgi:hypothetical protein